jgi:hypothetical protein
MPQSMATKRAAPVLFDLESAAGSVESKLRQSKFVKTSEFAKLGVPKAQHADVLSRLVAKGFEQTKTGIRAALSQQLMRVVDERKQVPCKGLEKLLRGATGTEVKALVGPVVQQGRLCRLLRGKAEWLASPDTDTLTLEELRVVQRVTTSLAAASKKVLANQKSKLAFWRSDLEELSAELDAIRKLRKSVHGPDFASESQRILAALVEAVDSHLELAYVPAAIRKSGLGIDAAQRALLDLAHAGVVELRADSGSARFTEEDLRLAPPGPDSSRLLWARLREGRR